MYTTRSINSYLRRLAILFGVGLGIVAPASAHQAVDPAIIRLIKPRTGPKPPTIVRPAGDPLVEAGRKLFFHATFGGNGRTCGTCHRAERNLTIDADFIRRLPKIGPAVRRGNQSSAQRAGEFDIAASVRAHSRESRRLRAPGCAPQRPAHVRPPASQRAGRGACRWRCHGLVRRWCARQRARSSSSPSVPWSSTSPRALDALADLDFVVPTQDQLDAMLAFQRSLGRQAGDDGRSHDPQARCLPSIPPWPPARRLFHACASPRRLTRAAPAAMPAAVRLTAMAQA